MSYNARALIVGNDHELVDMLNIYLGTRGFTVEDVSSGEDAIRRTLEFLPHVVLLDVTLPDIDGFEVCSRLRRQPRTAHIPVIFLTNRARRSDRMAGLSLGADDYITKPFDMHELYLRMRNAVDHVTRENTTDPLTGLPTGSMVRGQLTRVATDARRAIMRLTVVHAEAFRDVYGPLAFADIRAYLARLVMRAMNIKGAPQGFVGVVDQDTLAIVGTSGHLRAIGEHVADAFNLHSDKHYAEADLSGGYMDMDGRHVPIMQVQYQIFDTHTDKTRFIATV